MKPEIRLPTPLTITDISQVGIVVRDLTTSMERYWKTFGIGPWHIYTLAPPRLREPTIRGHLVPYSMKVAGADVGGLQLELIEPLDGPSIYKEFLDQHGDGLHHVLTRVEMVEEALAMVRQMGIDVIMSGKFGEGAFYYLDTEPVLGIILELAKRRTRPLPPPDAVYPPTASR